MAGHTLSPVDSTAHSSSLPQSAHLLDQSLHHMPGLSSGSVHFLEFSALLVSVKLSFLSLVLNLPFADVSVLLADAWGPLLPGVRSCMWTEVRDACKATASSRPNTNRERCVPVCLFLEEDLWLSVVTSSRCL